MLPPSPLAATDAMASNASNTRHVHQTQAIIIEMCEPELMRKKKLYVDIKKYDPILPTMKPNRSEQRRQSYKTNSATYTERIKYDVEKLSSPLHRMKKRKNTACLMRATSFKQVLTSSPVLFQPCRLMAMYLGSKLKGVKMKNTTFKRSH